MTSPIYIRSHLDLANAVAIGRTTEGLYLDFKATVDNWNVPKGTHGRDRIKNEAQKELCRDITQFANADGGCLLVGIEERKNGAGFKVAVREAPITESESLRAWIEDAIAKYCVPRTFSHSVDIINVSDGAILAVNIPPSPSIVYIWDYEMKTIEVMGRTSHGKFYLNPDELELHIMNGSRATRLSFERARDRAQSPEVIVVGGCWRQNMGPRDRWHLKNIKLGNSGDEWFELSIPVPRDDGTISAIASVAVPFGLLREVWVDATGRLNVLLSLELVYFRGDFGLRPTE